MRKLIAYFIKHSVAVNVIVIAFFAFKLRTKQKQLKKEKLKDKQLETKLKKEKETTQKKIDSVIKTLNEKEAAIVGLLLSNENKTELQSRIRHELGIPRTTLSRLLQSLEKKKIITIAKQGKIVKIKLTDWILEQE